MTAATASEPVETLPRPARCARAGVVALIVAAVSVGFAIHIQDGEYTVWALELITLALLGCVAAVVWPVVPLLRLREDRGPSRLLAAAIVLQLIALFVSWPGVDLPHLGRYQLLPFYAGLTAAFVLCVRILSGTLRTSERLWFPLLLLTWLLLAGWMIASSSRPFIDVWNFQQEGADALLSGKNPYAIRFDDIYHSTRPGRQQVYGPGLVENDRTTFGFPYPPVSLLLATAGYAVAGDHRFAQALALMLAGLFVGYGQRARHAMMAAALMMLSPRTFAVLGRGWTEPFGIMLLAATVFCAMRRSIFLPLALGLFLSTKQYLVLALPLTCFLLPPGWRWRDWIALLLKSFAVAALVTLPLALWNWHEFWKATVTVQEVAPFRWDALSYLVWWGFHGHGHIVTRPSVAVVSSLVAAIGALALGLWKAPRSPAGFAAALSLLCLAFFAFNKQAFCNYYYFVIGAMCCAIGAWQVDGVTTSTEKDAPDADQNQRLQQEKGEQRGGSETRAWAGPLATNG